MFEVTEAEIISWNIIRMLKTLDCQTKRDNNSLFLFNGSGSICICY